MPRSSQEIEQIEAELVKIPKWLRHYLVCFFHDGWSRWLAEAFPHNVPMMMIGADAAPESFRAMIMRNADLLHYLKNKNLGTATHLREKIFWAQWSQEKIYISFWNSWGLLQSIKIWSNFFSNPDHSSPTVLGWNKQYWCPSFVCTQSMPANDFVLECWQHLQNPSSHHFRVVLDEFATKIKANFQS